MALQWQFSSERFGSGWLTAEGQVSNMNQELHKFASRGKC